MNILESVFLQQKSDNLVTVVTSGGGGGRHFKVKYILTATLLEKISLKK